MEALVAPFTFAFMQKAFLLAVLVAVPTALLSCFLVLKGWSLMGDAMAHAVLPGVVAAYVLGVPLIAGAFAAGFGCALMSGWLDSNSRLKGDTVLGVVFSGMFGAGIVLHASVDSDVHLDHILFGNMLGVSTADLVQSGGIAAVVLIALGLRGRDLILHTFDPQQSRALGLPVRWLHYGLLSLLALTIVGALAATGLILTIAALIAPGAIAFLLTRRFERMLLVAVLVAVTTALLGVYLSFFLDSAPAPTIVLLFTAWFGLVVLLRARAGRAAAGKEGGFFPGARKTKAAPPP